MYRPMCFFPTWWHAHMHMHAIDCSWVQRAIKCNNTFVPSSNDATFITYTAATINTGNTGYWCNKSSMFITCLCCHLCGFICHATIIVPLGSISRLLHYHKRMRVQIKYLHLYAMKPSMLLLILDKDDASYNTSDCGKAGFRVHP